MIHIFTITAKNYLSLALTLGQSVARHHPEARFTVCVADGIDGIALNYEHPGHRLLDARDTLPAGTFDDMAFKYDVTEFCTSFKPATFKHIFATEADTELVHYMDPDTRLYSRLDPITADTPTKTLYLAPHLLDCDVADGNPYPEFHHLWEGIFNLGYCAIRRTPAMPLVLDWWDARLREYCYADHVDGLHTDQKWMDYAPVYFRDDLVIIEHYGANVSHWNLIERPLTRVDGEYRAGRNALIFFHFSGFDFKGTALNKYVPKEAQGAYTDGLLTDFAADYRAAVKANGYDTLIQIPYGFARFDDGTPVSKAQRRLYREFVKATPVQRPFSSAGVFYAALRDGALLDRSAAAAANYSKATVSDMDGKLRTVSRAMRWMLKLLGFRRYAQLVKLFSFLGRMENHRFLLQRPR
ncbi:hypothetical protein [Roseateles sp. BYS96W]|uniref:Glycosyl transferase n=1 Tax=Pelomonas nitida TaxID=3299027 RepID=A0ABW7G4Q7_9BURK